MGKTLKSVDQKQAKISSFFSAKTTENLSKPKELHVVKEFTSNTDDDESTAVLTSTSCAQLKELRLKEAAYYRANVLDRGGPDDIRNRKYFNHFDKRVDMNGIAAATHNNVTETQPDERDGSITSIHVIRSDDCDPSNHKNTQYINKNYAAVDDMNGLTSSVGSANTTVDSSGRLEGDPYLDGSDIIPGTPDPLTSTLKNSRTFSRSFLRPIGSGSGSDTKIRDKPKTKLRERQCNHSPVTVRFNSKVTSHIHEDLSSKCDHSFKELSSLFTVNDSEKDSPSLIGLKYNSGLQAMPEPIKRSADSGLSPYPKRSVSKSERQGSALCSAISNNREQYFKCKSRLHFDSDTSDTIPQCTENLEMKSKTISNSIGIGNLRNSYQLGITELCVDGKKDNLYLDDVLSEILDEMNSCKGNDIRKSLDYSSVTIKKKTTKPMTTCPQTDLTKFLNDTLDACSSPYSNVTEQLKTIPMTDKSIEQFITPPCDNSRVQEHNKQLNNCSPLDVDLFDQSFSMPEDFLSATIGMNGNSTVLTIRYTVINVEHRPSQIVIVARSMSDQFHHIYLNGFWSDTRVKEKDVIHVINAEKTNSHEFRITDQRGVIVVNPDTLVSGTSVVSGIHCMRQAVLNHFYKGCDTDSVIMLHGNIIHAFFQKCLLDGITEVVDMETMAKKLIQQRFILDLYKQQLSVEDVLVEIKKYIPPIRSWLLKHSKLGLLPSESNSNDNTDVSLLKLHDIEENIWSPRYGIKGKIDVTAEVKIHRKGIADKCSVIPVELKTGRSSYSMEHQGQVTLYTLMMNDRAYNPDEGLLLYLKDGGMKLVELSNANSRGLIQLRNELAFFLHNLCDTSGRGQTCTKYPELPEPINNERWCQKCPQLLNCTAHISNVTELPQMHAMHSLVPSALAHLSSAHLLYYHHWCTMLRFESSVINKFHPKFIWTESAITREQKGECLSDMKLTSTTKDNQSQLDFRQLRLTFTRGSSQRALSSIGIEVGDNVVVSGQSEPLFALAIGQVVTISATHVILLTDMDISRWCIGNRRFRLDKTDLFSTMGSLFYSVSLLMANNSRSEKLRRLIIDKESPIFQSTLPKKSIQKVKKFFQPLNKPQKTVILKALLAEDYVIINGYPGTGKTSTIVSLVKILCALGQSVLLASYTHSAVDNILLKLKQDNIDFLRLGRLSRIQSALHSYSAEMLTRNISDVDKLRELYDSKGVVATTCLGMNHPIFTQRTFDVCIIDEASQVIQPACLSPLFVCSKFILVGDTKQLSPVVQNKQAQKIGMSESLFARLEPCGATFDLHLQYRMNREIMSLCNHLVYNGALLCATEQTACQGIIELRPAPQELLNTQPWMGVVLSSHLSNSVVFLDTSNLSHAKEKKGNSGLVGNIGEANLVFLVIRTLHEFGFPLVDLGVIAPYRNQVSIIKRLLSENAHYNDVEVNTVDQYQGRDKSLVIISFTRSKVVDCCPSNIGGELLKDVRRLNVAITRAKHKLIFIGDINTLQEYEPVKHVISLLADKAIIVKLTDEITEIGGHDNDEV